MPADYNSEEFTRSILEQWFEEAKPGFPEYADLEDLQFGDATPEMQEYVINVFGPIIRLTAAAVVADRVIANGPKKKPKHLRVVDDA